MARQDDDERQRRRGPGEQRLIDRIMRDVASWFESEPDPSERQRDRRRGGEDRRRDDDQSGKRDFGTDSAFGRPYGDTLHGGGGKYRGVGPKGYKRSPEQLKERIAERLAEHEQLNASEIEIEVDDDEVTLTGRVPSRRQKRLAEDCAESLLGIRDIHNRLAVDPDMEQGAF